MAWLKRMWIPLVINIVNLLIFGPGAQYIVRYFGNSLDDVATLIFNLSACFLAVIIIDLAFDKRKGWGIFPTLDVDNSIRRAQSTPVGAALVWLGFIILFVSILFIAVPRAHGAILDKAKPYLPQLSNAIDRCWPGLTMRQFPAGQVEKESGWNPRATLKTSRELGRGFSQLTIAWDKTGKERFNSFKDAMDYRELQGWNWRNNPFDVGYQLKALVLRDRDSFRQVRPFVVNDAEALKIAAVIFNAGDGRYRARKVYAKLHGFKTDRWSGGLELAHGPKENATLYGEKLWVTVNRYPTTVFQLSTKYQGLV